MRRGSNVGEMNMKTRKHWFVAVTAIVCAGVAATPAAFAGFLHGVTGQGHAVNLLDGLDANDDNMIDAGKVLTDAQKAYIDAIQAEFGLAANDDNGALAQAKIMKKHVCEAIEQVKRQNAMVGQCLDVLKSKGLLCIAFGFPADIAGAAINDGKVECNENDKINISGKFLRNINRYPAGHDDEGVPRPYDTSFMCLVLTLLHEGKHAIQDYNPATLGLDACKARATKNKRRVCNEASDGAGGEDKGAHVIENEWIAELKTELNKLKMNMPTDPNASDATKNILMAFTNDFPNQKQRNMAIDTYVAHLCAVERSNNLVIACYRAAKEAFDVFITTNYKTPEEKAATLKILRDTLRDMRWRRIISRFDLPRITLLSEGSQSVIQQFDDMNGDFPLDTGLGGGVADMVMPFGPDAPWLLVLGSDQFDVPFLQGYFDNNGNGIFEPTEQAFVSPPMLPLSTDLDFINVLPFGGGMFVADWENGMIWPLTDTNMDEIPDQLLPQPVHQFFGDITMIQDFFFDPLLQTVFGTDEISLNNVAMGFDDPLLGLPAENFDLDPLNNIEFPLPFYDALLYPPVPFGPLPVGGDMQMDIGGYDVDAFFDIAYQVEIIDPATNLPAEVIGGGAFTMREPIPTPLDRPLVAGEWVRITDDTGMHTPIFIVGNPCLADLNGDGLVNGADLAALLAAWGPCFPGDPCDADFNNDGFVDGADLASMLAAWGPC